MDIVQLTQRLEKHLLILYSEEEAYTLLRNILELVQAYQAEHRHLPSDKPRWSEEDVLLITYADSIKSPHITPLASLKEFADQNFKDIFSIIHILPFFPYSSDDGFAIYDFDSVCPDMGTKFGTL